jgi:periplasmic divalent cation tolerance protein
VKERLVACTNIVNGVKSVYRWEGEVTEDQESLLVMKTTADRVAALTARLKAAHPYEIPEVVALEIGATEGNHEYLQWVAASVRDA